MERKIVLISALLVFGILITFLFVSRLGGNTSISYTPGPAAEKTIPSNLISRLPADPAASPEARSLLEYFYTLSLDARTRFIIGQNIGHASHIRAGENGNPFEGMQQFVDELNKKTGKTPALIGMGSALESENDEMNLTASNKLLIDHWKKGGIVEISFAPRNPWTLKSLDDFGTGTFEYDALFTPGTSVNTQWNADLDQLAAGLDELQKAGVVVLFRPFQEMNGNWFWWSYDTNGRASQGEYVRLWRYVYTYLTKEKGIHNLLWVYGPNTAAGNNNVKPAIYYYPGDDVVDIVGLNYYTNNLSRLNERGDVDALLALGKPFGLPEVGAGNANGIDNYQLLKLVREQFPNIVYAMLWNSRSGTFGLSTTKLAIIDNPHAQELMNSDNVITLQNIEAL